MKESTVSLRFDFDVHTGDFSRAGDASSKVKKILQQIGVDPNIIRRVAVACYEAEMNIVIHAHADGLVALDANLERVEIVVSDHGQGIEDVEQAMIPGFSTAPDSIRELGFGAGMGLPNMKNCSSEFKIKSEKGVGTTIRMVFENA